MNEDTCSCCFFCFCKHKKPEIPILENLIIDGENPIHKSKNYYVQFAAESTVKKTTAERFEENMCKINSILHSPKYVSLETR